MNKICAYVFCGIISGIILFASYVAFRIMVIEDAPLFLAWPIVIFGSHLSLSGIEVITKAWAGEKKE